jgi:hypothetical protein
VCTRVGTKTISPMVNESSVRAIVAYASSLSDVCLGFHLPTTAPLHITSVSHDRTAGGGQKLSTAAEPHILIPYPSNFYPPRNRRNLSRSERSLEPH